MPGSRDLFEAVRKLAPPRAWSDGVSLARGGAVSLESNDGEELVARVAVAGSPVSPRVTLYPEAGEWDCDCASPLDACEHVAAAVVAERQGQFAAARDRPIEYRLRRTPEGIHFERGVTTEAGFEPLRFTLEAVASGRLLGPRFDASPEDLAVEKALRGTFEGVLARETVPRLFGALASMGRVTLDGEPVPLSAEPVLAPIVVEDAPDGGFLLHIDEPRGVSETFPNGVVLAEGELRPFREASLLGREREELSRGRYYRPSEVATLVGDVLPSLRQRAPVEIRTERLPGATREAPRIGVFCERQDDRLYVLPRIVYGDPPHARIDGDRLVALGGAVPLRDVDAERKVEERALRRLGLRVGRGEELEAPEAVELVAKLRSSDVVIEGSGAEAFHLHAELVPRLSVEAGDFSLAFESGSRRADPRGVLRAFREGRSLVPLVDGGFAPLPFDWLQRYGEQIEDLLAAREAQGRLPKASLLDLAKLSRELDQPEPPGLDELKALLSDFTALPEASIPSSLRVQLRDYQREGVDWLAFLRSAGLGGLLADDMGLGKTIQALAALEGRTLVAAPTSVLVNWIEEAKRFRPELRRSLYHGRDRKLDPEADVTVTSHALLRLDREILSAVSWDTVVIDEAQAMRNPETELARAAYDLEARFRVSLTGTPIENRLVDLWSQFHFLAPGFLGGLADFEERYVRPTERGETEPLARLRERIRPFFLRRIKSEVAPELPPRTESTLRCELTEDERDLYEAMRLAARKDVTAKLSKGGSVLAALEALLRLRQAACHPSLVPGREARTSSKTELLLSTLETAASEGHKSLVFSQWTSMLDLLEPRLTEAGYRHERLDGSTRDRASVVERFQSDPEISVFLVSLKAGGTGLNLTAADHVFLFDPWWNPAVEAQAFDRAHRIGQEKPVFVYRLVAADTVEERILDLQEEKRALAELAASETSGPITRDDLLRLLE